jgi:hypothetical protein
MPVEKAYQFEGPKGKASLLDLFEDHRQLIVYRAFFEPGVAGWPDHACRGCSFHGDQVSHLAHLNARDTTLVWASRVAGGHRPPEGPATRRCDRRSGRGRSSFSRIRPRKRHDPDRRQPYGRC